MKDFYFVFGQQIAVKYYIEVIKSLESAWARFTHCPNEQKWGGEGEEIMILILRTKCPIISTTRARRVFSTAIITAVITVSNKKAETSPLSFVSLLNLILLVGLFLQYLTRDILYVDSGGNLWGKKPLTNKNLPKQTQSTPPTTTAPFNCLAVSEQICKSQMK